MQFKHSWQVLLVALVGCQAGPFELADRLDPIAPTKAVGLDGDADAGEVTEAVQQSDIGAVKETSGGELGFKQDSDPPALLAAHQATQGETTVSPLPPMPVSDQRMESERQPLALADLESIAVTQNPAISEAVARVEAVRGQYLQVGLPPNPTVGYTAGEIGDDGSAGQQGAFLSQEIVRGKKLKLNREAAAWEVRKAEQELAALEQRVLTDVRVGYYTLLIAQDRLGTTERLAEVGARAVEAVDALLNVGEATRTELLQAKVEAETATLLVENARATRFGAWQRLAPVLGDSRMPLAQVIGNAALDLPSIEFVDALERILSQNPLLAAQRSEIERARWALRRARAEVIPNVTLQGSVQYDDASNFTIAGVQVGLPIPILNRNEGGIRQAREEVLAAEQALGRLELALERQLATVYQRYQTARQQVDRYSKDILSDVDETLRLTTKGYRAGEFNFLQMLTAQRTYFQTHLAYLDALGEMWASSRQIDGLLLSNSLETGAGVQ